MEKMGGAGYKSATGDPPILWKMKTIVRHLITIIIVSFYLKKHLMGTAKII